jgi:hypothetical protein
MTRDSEKCTLSRAVVLPDARSHHTQRTLPKYTVLGTQLKPAGARLSDHMSIQVASWPGWDVSAKTGAGTRRV